MRLVSDYKKQARAKRGQIFRDAFALNEETKILDLGSASGAHIHGVLKGTRVRPQNVYIADISVDNVAVGQEKYGFRPVAMGESGPAPFKDHSFDIVFCSSVIEHVTIPKERVWRLYSGKDFRAESFARQKEFAAEIKRLGKGYFVQTPYRHFIIESHSLLPFAGWLPRELLIPLLHLSNRLWMKKTRPDWHLLDKEDMHELFDGAEIAEEKAFGLTKSIIAVKS